MEQKEPAEDSSEVTRVELEDGTVLERHGDELQIVSSTGAETRWPVPDKWVQTVEKVGQVDKLSKSKTPVIHSVRWQTRELRVDGQGFSYSDPSGSKKKGECKFMTGAACRLVNAGDRIQANAFEVPNPRLATSLQNTLGVQNPMGTTSTTSQPSTHLVGAHNVFIIYLPKQEVGAADAALASMPVTGLDGDNIASTAGKANAASKKTRARTYYFGAESPVAAKEWVDAINANLKAHTSSGNVNDSAVHELARNFELVGVDVSGVDLVATMNQLMASPGEDAPAPAPGVEQALPVPAEASDAQAFIPQLEQAEALQVAVLEQAHAANPTLPAEDRARQMEALENSHRALREAVLGTSTGTTGDAVSTETK